MKGLFNCPYGGWFLHKACVVGVFFMFCMISGCVSSSDSKSVALTSALEVSNQYVSVYRGTSNFDDLDKTSISSTIIDTLETFKENFESKEEDVLNVDEFFFNYSEDSESGRIKESGTTEVLRPSDFDDDPRIYYDNGVAYVKLKDLDPEGWGVESIQYKGVELKIDMTEEYFTSSKVEADPTNIFRYSEHKFSEVGSSNVLDLLYLSPLDKGKFLRFTFMYTKGGYLTEFSVVSS